MAKQPAKAVPRRETGKIASGDNTPKETPKRRGNPQTLAPAWVPGVSPNPKGRPKGSRNKLGEEFLSALQEDFTKHGADTITKVREERPHEYLKIVAGILPKELNVKTNAVEELTDEELAAAIEILRQQVNSRDEEVPPRQTH